ncbi:ADP-ribosylglycohydrolase family protein [Clostridium chromiireducens]|uniref:ADP-ribosyl-[dinitrogen reductase] glycohydrolase n=2 Tax=Clostridium chromiireducens TaxID=225345 RepID=A0A1V4J0Y2_9CLOT|nr:ADP-ribosylglycohydrolase family protein [Clostridium chromiireducens]OPJ65307.1 ADP-ribosyl-[dinitrogen reductase] glycohydrolase [Clostridium chromiireducens]
MMNMKERFIGCIIGGALGDALGYPIEFYKLDEIYHKYGKSGIEDLDVNIISKKALISDDTQMTLFTIDGILDYEYTSRFAKEKNIQKSIFHAYVRWLYTQGCTISKEYNYLMNENDSRLLKYNELYDQRFPGNSCLTALQKSKNDKFGTIENRINGSKGCGGVMRAAPAGLYYVHRKKDAFILGCELAAITHGHPTGYLTAGALSSIISDLCLDVPIDQAIINAIKILKTMGYSEETIDALNKALLLAKEGNPSSDKLSKLGEGWIGEEALSIAVYCALSYPEDFKEALKLAVNHSGDSDSTGAICGNIMGAKLGVQAIPEEWIYKVELGGLIKEMTEELYKNIVK